MDPRSIFYLARYLSYFVFYHVAPHPVCGGSVDLGSECFAVLSWLAPFFWLYLSFHWIPAGAINRGRWHFLVLPASHCQ